jgi:hypothetical protein
MVRQNQFYHRPSGIDHPHGMCMNFHSFRTFSFAGRSQISPPLHFNNADPATARFILKIHVIHLHVTQRWNFDANGFSSLQQGGPFFHHHRFIVYS